MTKTNAINDILDIFDTMLIDDMDSMLAEDGYDDNTIDAALDAVTNLIIHNRPK